MLWKRRQPKHGKKYYVPFEELFAKLAKEDQENPDYMERLESIATELFRKSPPPLEGLPYMKELEDKGIYIHWY